MKKVFLLSMMALFAVSAAMAQPGARTQIRKKPVTISKAVNQNTEATKAMEEQKASSKAEAQQNAAQISDKPGLNKFNDKQAAKKAEEEQKKEVENDVKSVLNSIKQDAEEQKALQNNAKVVFGETKEKAEAALWANAPKPIIDYVKKNYPYEYIGRCYWWESEGVYEVDLLEKSDNRLHSTIYFNSQYEKVRSPRISIPKNNQNANNKPKKQPKQL